MGDTASPAHICSVCQDGFASRNKLFQHVRTAHEAKTETETETETASPGPTTATGGTVSGKKSKSGRPGRVARRRNKDKQGKQQPPHEPTIQAQRAQQTPRLTSLEGFCRRALTTGGTGAGLTLEDAQIITDQLGFAPTNLIEVGSRNKETGHPEVVVLYGLNHNEAVGGRYSRGDAKPFPTFLWMSCPLLKARISKLEDRGLVAEFQAKLTGSTGNDSGSYVQQMEVAHKLYAAERWQWLTPEDVATVQRNKWEYNLRDVGVAGMRTADGVKCLHCHYAHWLARPQHGNIIGQWTHEALLRYDEEIKQLEEVAEEEEEEEEEEEGMGGQRGSKQARLHV